MASDTPRIELAPNLAGRNIEAVTQLTDAVSEQWCGNMSLHVYVIPVHVMWLTFVVSAVHFNHHVVQFLLFQHIDSLEEKTKGHSRYSQSSSSFTIFLLKIDQILRCYSQTG